MTVFLLRHGQTRGNLERRYTGSTDEPLCPQGKAELEGVRPPEAEYVYVSPMIRCRETSCTQEWSKWRCPASGRPVSAFLRGIPTRS